MCLCSNIAKLEYAVNNGWVKGLRNMTFPGIAFANGFLIIANEAPVTPLTGASSCGGVS